MWQLTFMVERQRRVVQVPEEWLDEIRPLVEQGREFKDAMAEVFAANAQLLALGRKEMTELKRRRRKGKDNSDSS